MPPRDQWVREPEPDWAATDFFSVEVVAWRGLVRSLVLCVIDLETRRIEIAGASSAPNEAWACLIARALTAPETGSADAAGR